MSLRAAILDVLDREPQETRMLEFARLYVDRGWSVFPLAAGSKVPISRKELGIAPGAPAGVSIASRKSDDIEGWWDQHPDWNIGVACGPSNLVVIDADLYKPGTAQTWAALAEELGPLETFTVKTPRGGCHYRRHRR